MNHLVVDTNLFARLNLQLEADCIGVVRREQTNPYLTLANTPKCHGVLVAVDALTK